MISGWERGEIDPSSYYRTQLCAILKKSPEELELLSHGRESGPEGSEEALGGQQAVVEGKDLPAEEEGIFSSHVPSPNPYFTGRRETLERIRAHLATDEALAVLSGLGGIGKTQITVAYAYHHKNDYRYVLWAIAETADRLALELVNIAKTLDLPEQTAPDLQTMRMAVLRWLHTQRNWLLILDNVDDPDIVDAFLPRSGHGHVLVTTQDAEAFPQAIRVEGFTEEEGVPFLLHRAGMLSPERALEEVAEGERMAAKQIVREMEGLPLALDQAGAFIRETQTSIEKYLVLFRAQEGKLLAMRGRRTLNHPASLAATVSLAFDKINPVPGSQDVLRFSAFLQAQRIPEELFRIGTPQVQPLFEASPAGEVQLSQALQALLRYSLIARHPDDATISLHRLVQAVIADLMGEGLQKQWMGRVIDVVSALFSEMNLLNWPSYERYIVSALACVEWINRRQVETEAAASLLASAGKYLLDRAQYPQVETLFEKALAIRSRILPDEHPDRSDSLYELGVLYLNQGKFGEAEIAIRQSIELLAKSHETWHPVIVSSLNTLAEVSYQQGRYEEAESIFLDVLRERIVTYGEKHAFVGTTFECLGQVYETQGRHEDAQYAFRSALEISEQTLGANHPSVVRIRHELAELYMHQTLSEQATSLVQETLQGHEQGKVIGASELDTADALRVQGLVYLKQQRYEQAASLLEQALELRLKALHQEHPAIAESRHDLGELYLKQKMYDKAEPLIRKALRVRMSVFGPLHLNVAQTLSLYGDLCDVQGRHAESEWYYQQTLDILTHIVKTGESSLEIINTCALLSLRLGLTEQTEK